MHFLAEVNSLSQSFAIAGQCVDSHVGLNDCRFASLELLYRASNRSTRPECTSLVA